MFDEEFYPTPRSVIWDMVAPYQLHRHTILEPSAGKGDILDFVAEKTRCNVSDLYAIEQHHELAEILKGKGYRYIHSDFLTYSGDYAFDLILMNPPFSNGDKHLLKAWEILEEGHICCLLNAETVRNPNSKYKQQLVQLIDAHGSVTYLGAAFADAERRTNVDVAMVRLEKKGTGGSRFDFFQNRKKEEQVQLDENTLGNQVARQDVIGNMVLYYQQSKKAFMEYMQAFENLKFHMTPLLQGSDKVETAIASAYNEKTKQRTYNRFMDELKGMAWKNIFSQTKIADIVTRKVRDDFDKFSKAEGCLDFTPENIEGLFDMLFLNRGTIMQKCLEETFDRMCRYDKKNRVHWEGWKTNDAYKVNRKVIMPYMIEYEGRWGRKEFSVSYHRNYSDLEDIDKVMCMLSGKKFEDIATIHNTLRKRFRGISHEGEEGNTAESEFFQLKFFQKGTLHLYFKDEYLWQQFNIQAAKGKNWLPDTK